MRMTIPIYKLFFSGYLSAYSHAYSLACFEENVMHSSTYSPTYSGTNSTAKKRFKTPIYFCFVVGMPKIYTKQLVLSFKNKKVASIGIGTMIVFIAMVLVAGIAASVLMQTSVSLESQAMKSGQDTKNEVSSDIDVIEIMGDYNTRDIGGTPYARIHNMTITVTARSASAINLGDVIVQLSNGSKMCILNYSNSAYASQPSANGLFATSGVFDLGPSTFGVVVEHDADISCSDSNPVINEGDKVMITVNLSACFGGLPTRADIEGMVIPEHGSPGVILFRTPPTNSKPIVELI